MIERRETIRRSDDDIPERLMRLEEGARARDQMFKKFDVDNSTNHTKLEDKVDEALDLIREWNTVKETLNKTGKVGIRIVGVIIAFGGLLVALWVALGHSKH